MGKADSLIFSLSCSTSWCVFRFCLCCCSIGLLAGNDVLEGLGGHGLGALEGEAKTAGPDEVSEAAERAGDSEEDGVVLHLGEAVVLEEDTRVGINVGPGVLGLALLGEDLGHDVVELGGELEERVVGEVLEGELALAGVPRVSLAEHGVAVSGDDLAGLEGLPDVVLDLLVGEAVTTTELLAEISDPLEDLLVGEAVEGTGETGETGRVGEVRVGEGGADQVGAVSGNVASLVGRVDCQVQAHEVNELLVLANTELPAEVVRPVSRGISGTDLAILECVAVDAGGNAGDLGEEIHRVLIGVVPVLVLVDTLVVGLGEAGLGAEGRHGGHKLSHGVEGLGEAVDHLLDVGREGRAASPLLGDGLGLLVGGDLTGHQKPEETLGKGLLTSRSLGQDLLKVGDRVSLEANSLKSQKNEKKWNELKKEKRVAKRS